MKTIRIATFNCENLFVYHRLRNKDLRFKTEHDLDDLDFDGSGVSINALKGGWSITKDQRHATARGIISRQPDVIALQEIESLDVLNKFLTDFVNKKKVKDMRGSGKKIKWNFKYRILIDGNDNHKIDVALLSRFPIKDVRTHFWERIPNTSIDYFPRDCLEVDIELPNKKILTFLVNHLTSRASDRIGTKRERQALRIIEILKERFGSKLDKGNFIVCGDLNDSPTNNALKNTLYAKKLGLLNPIATLPKEQQWTHYWYYDSGTPRKEPFAQLDHLLLSPSFKKDNKMPVVEIERRGLLQTFWKKADPSINKEKPFKGVTDKPGTEGSDHCGVFVDLNIDNLI